MLNRQPFKRDIVGILLILGGTKWEAELCKCYYILGNYKIRAHLIKTTTFAGFVRQFKQVFGCCGKTNIHNWVYDSYSSFSSRKLYNCISEKCPSAKLSNITEAVRIQLICYVMYVYVVWWWFELHVKIGCMRGRANSHLWPHLWPFVTGGKNQTHIFIFTQQDTTTMIYFLMFLKFPKSIKLVCPSVCQPKPIFYFYEKRTEQLQKSNQPLIDENSISNDLFLKLLLLVTYYLLHHTLKPGTFMKGIFDHGCLLP